MEIHSVQGRVEVLAKMMETGRGVGLEESFYGTQRTAGQLELSRVSRNMNLKL